MTTPDDSLRAFTRRLFHGPDTTVPPEEPDPPQPNHVPSEGHSPTPARDPDRDWRRYVARLLDTPDQDHI